MTKLPTLCRHTAPSEPVPAALISGSSQNIGQCQRPPSSSSLSLSSHRSTRSGRLDVPSHGGKYGLDIHGACSACDNGRQQVVVVTVLWRDVGHCQPLATSNFGIRAEHAPSRYRPGCRAGLHPDRLFSNSSSE